MEQGRVLTYYVTKSSTYQDTSTQSSDMTRFVQVMDVLNQALPILQQQAQAQVVRY